jgi:hypothetical protein
MVGRSPVSPRLSSLLHVASSRGRCGQAARGKRKMADFFFIVGNAGLRLVMDDASLIEREQDVVGG